MSKLSYVIPSTGQKNTVAEPAVDTALTSIQTWANGEIGTGNIEAGTVTEAMLAAAVQTLLNVKSAGSLTVVKKNEASFSVATGEWVIMEKESSEVKLPAASANRILAVTCANGINAITIKAPVAKTIFGDFLVEETTIVLGKNQHVLLQADGTNWNILAGEPRRTRTMNGPITYTQAEAEAGVELNAARACLVTVYSTSALTSVLAEAQTVAAPVAKESPVTFWLNPAQKWKAAGAAVKATWQIL